MKDIILVLFAIVLIVVLSRNARSTDIPLIVTKIDTVYKTDTTTIYKKGTNVPFVVLDTLHLIDEIHDTVFIIKDYNQVKAYSDTIKVDSSSFVILDTISHNSLIGRRFIAQISEKMIYKSISTERKPRNEVYLGFIGDLRHDNNKIGLGVGLALKTSKNALFSLNATTNNYSLSYMKKL